MHNSFALKAADIAVHHALSDHRWAGKKVRNDLSDLLPSTFHVGARRQSHRKGEVDKLNQLQER